MLSQLNAILGRVLSIFLKNTIISRNQRIFFGGYVCDTDVNILIRTKVLVGKFSFEYRLKGFIKLKRLRTTVLE